MKHASAKQKYFIRWKYLHLWEKIFNICAPVGKVFHEMKILAFATKDTFASLGKVHLAHLLIRLICPSQEPLNFPKRFPVKMPFFFSNSLFRYHISDIRYQRKKKQKTKKQGPFNSPQNISCCKNTFLLFSHFKPSLLRIYISVESESIMRCPDKEQLTIRLRNKLNKQLYIF